MTTSIFIRLPVTLPDDAPTMDTNRSFNTGLRAFRQHHILMILPMFFYHFVSVLPHTITRCNLSFKRRTLATNKRLHLISLYPIREDTSDAYFELSNGLQKSSSCLYTFSLAKLLLA
jgi:hypothetical protein